MPPTIRDGTVQRLGRDGAENVFQSEVAGGPRVMEPTVDKEAHRWSMSSGEFELQTATQPHKKRKKLHRWILPSTDSDDEHSYPKVPHKPKPQLTPLRFNLPSDSEGEHDDIADKYCDENPYEFATSPTRVIDMDVPPLPPPISSIPSRPRMGKNADNVAVQCVQYVHVYT